jgi:hypothetical protein
LGHFDSRSKQRPETCCNHYPSSKTKHKIHQLFIDLQGEENHRGAKGGYATGKTAPKKGLKDRIKLLQINYHYSVHSHGLEIVFFNLSLHFLRVEVEI